MDSTPARHCRDHSLTFWAVTTTEVALTAALGAAFLTAAASLGVVMLREWRQGKASRQAALHAAVQELLTRSIAVSLRAEALRETIRIRSGPLEGIDVVILRLRKPLDPLALHDWQAQDMVPLNAALNEIWTLWDQKGIRLAEDLVGKCMNLVEICLALVPAKTHHQRLRKTIAGERWTPQMEKEYERARTEMMAARRLLADYTRTTLKQPAVDLIAQLEAPDQDNRKELPAGST